MSRGYPGQTVKISPKAITFSKKIWQQAKAGYLCAPLLKKGKALKKKNDAYAIEKRKKIW